MWMLWGAAIFLLWWLFFPFVFLLLLRILCILFCFCCPYYGGGGSLSPFCMFLLPSLWVFWFPLLWMFLFSFVGISVLILLQMIETFGSILKGSVIYSSSCSNVHISLQCERCLDIDSLRTRSRDTNCWLFRM